jgi:hypothetical protein
MFSAISAATATPFAIDPIGKKMFADLRRYNVVRLAGSLTSVPAASAWIGFGPDRGLTKLQYRKLDAHLAALREATSQALVDTAHPRQGEGDTAAVK